MMRLLRNRRTPGLASRAITIREKTRARADKSCRGVNASKAPKPTPGTSEMWAWMNIIR